MTLPDVQRQSLHRIDTQISECTGQAFESKTVDAVAGGCINTARIIGDGATHFFIKLNSAQYLPMFEAEAQGLRELAAVKALHVPSPVCHGKDDDHAWLVLDHLAILGSPAMPDWGALGQGLAMLHRHRQNRYGWHRDNTIGLTEQKNVCSANWVDFFREFRLRYQLDLALHNGFSGQLQSRGERLLGEMSAFFSTHTPEASLLHGDLWSGNSGFLGSGEPVIFDPAVYFGDRETDIAMTELFGGFAGSFYSAYESAWPLDSGFNVRKHLYNLYHLLNHLNLFGRGYLAQCEATIDGLLAEL